MSSSLLSLPIQTDQGPHTGLTLEFKWQPKQHQLFQAYEHSPFTIIGYGGSRGGAKSHGGREVILARRLMYPNTKALVFRKTYNDLLENHIEPLFSRYPWLRPFYNKSERTLTLYVKNEATGEEGMSVVIFGYAEHHDDIYAFFGKDYADIMIDEATDLEQDQIEFLQTCNRCTTNTQIVPKMLLTMNPGRVGHNYIKRIFIDGEYEANEEPEAYHFIQAFAWDNVEWVRRKLTLDGFGSKDYYSWPSKKRFDYFITHSDYGKRLNSLPEGRRQADLFGDWDIYAGQFFNEFRKAYHVIPAKGFSLHPQMNVMGGLDYGQRTAFEVAAEDWEGNLTFFGEVWTEHQAPSERALAIANFLLERKLYNINLLYDTNMDIDLKEYYGHGVAPIKDFKAMFEKVLGNRAPHLHPMRKDTNDKRGWRVVANEVFHEALRWQAEKDGALVQRPRVRITESCPRLIESVTSLQHFEDAAIHKAKGLDFDQTIGVDDPYDAAKAVVLAIRAPAKPKGRKSWEERFAEGARKQHRGWRLGVG